MLKLTIAFTSVVVAVPTLAYTHDSFYGWAPDGSYYARASAGTDMVERPEICVSEGRNPPPSWPKGVERPSEGACTSLCGDEVECNKASTAKKLVRLPAASPVGPHGERVDAKIAKDHATVTGLGEWTPVGDDHV